MTSHKSLFAHDTINLAPYRYIGESVPPRAAGLGAPLPNGTVVYLDAKAERAWRRSPERRLATVNMLANGDGASFRVRLTDLRPVERVA